MLLAEGPLKAAVSVSVSLQLFSAFKASLPALDSSSRNTLNLAECLDIAAILEAQAAALGTDPLYSDVLVGEVR